MASFWIKDSLRDVCFSDMYAMGKELGKGPTAVVHKCVQRGTGPWAVKVIPKEQIKRQIKPVQVGILFCLKHPNVIRLREIYETENRIYLINQLETGGDLLDRVVTQGTYTEQDVAKCIRNTLRGLAYLHENGITHRNLKPENLLYDSLPDSNVLKIADFGVSQIIGPEVKKHVVCHMPGFVAPEILQGAEGGLEMDLWSVGVIAYLLLSGCEPFHCEDPSEVYKKIIKCEYSMYGPEWACVTDNAKDLVRKLLVLNPAERMSAKQALMHLWVKGEAAGEEHMEETQSRLKQLNLQRKAQRVMTEFCIPEEEIAAPVQSEEVLPEEEVVQTEEMKPAENETQQASIEIQATEE